MFKYYMYHYTRFKENEFEILGILLFDIAILGLKDLNSTVAKRGPVFIGLMTPDGAIWSRYQRAVIMR